MPGNTNNTRDRILQAALDLFLQQGIRKTSIDDVADRAGVTRVTVYRHFSDREQLIGEAFLEINAAFDRVREALEEEQDLDGDPARVATGLSWVPPRRGLPPADVYAIHRVRSILVTGVKLRSS